MAHRSMWNLAWTVLKCCDRVAYNFYWHIITGPPNKPVLFCLLASVVVVCNAAGGRADCWERAKAAWERCRRSARSPAAWTVGARRPGTWVVWWPTLHGGPVRLRPARTTPCFSLITSRLAIGVKRLGGLQA